VTLLSSAPMDWAGPYRVPWAMTFLLKPNHALGLLLAPWVVRAVAHAQRDRDRLMAGLLLHLLGWAFVIHMGALCVGLVALVVLFRRDRLGRVWCGLAVGALALWLAYYPLHFLQQAKERDDVYYWLRVNLALCAAVGAWDLAGRLLARWRMAAEESWRAAAVA